MRPILTVLGTCGIAAYALFGAALMNDWAIVAASGLPLDATVTEMALAKQSYSAIPGIVFAVAGILLALGWAAVTLARRVQIPWWGSLAIWAAIITFGAFAYYFSSLGNMMSVGDAFYEWDSEAAWSLQAPVYLVGGIAFLVSVGALITGIVQGVTAKLRHARNM